MGHILPVPVQIKLLREVPLPRYETPGSVGMDLRAWVSGETEYFTIDPMEIVVIPTGVAIALPDGYEAQVRPRSGFTTKGFVAMLGTIDTDYRGEIAVTLINFNPCHRVIRHLDRIAQVVVAPVSRVAWDEVASLSETVRGERGHGSTGDG